MAPAALDVSFHDARSQHISDPLEDCQCKTDTIEVGDHLSGFHTLRREIPAAAPMRSSISSELHLTHLTLLLSPHTPTEDSLSDDTERGCENCAEVPDTSHWILVEPEVSIEKTVSIYTLTSAAGNYECSKSGLRWSCAGQVTVQYQFIDWYVFAKELAQMQCSPAGPLMDIKLMSGELEEIHLPHFLCLGGCQLALKDVVKVLHEQDGGVYLETCELTRHHARLIQPSLSPRGLLYDFTSWLLGKVHANVLVYQCSESHLVFRCYLLPEDAHLKEKVERDEEKCGGVKKLYPNPHNSLQINEFYCLCGDESTDSVPTINPDKLELRYSRNTPNFFQVELPDPDPAAFHMQLFSSASKEQPVWRAKFQTATKGRQTRGSGLTEGIASGMCSADRIGGAVGVRGEGEAGGVETIDGPSQPSRVPVQVDSKMAAVFVDDNRAKIVDRVEGVMPIADQLLSQSIIGQETYKNIHAATTSQDKMRRLYFALRSPGDRGKLAFYRILQAQEPYLVEELWTAQ